jgi:hypothetical protein
VKPRQQARRPFLAWRADAWWFIRFATIEPVKRFQPVARWITALGIAIPIAVAVQWVGGILPTTIVFLVGVIVLLIAGGARLVRSDIVLGDVQVDGQEMRLDVLNQGARTGTFKATIVEVTPRLQLRNWLVKWDLEPDALQVEIPGRGRSALLLGVGSLTRRDDGLLGGSVAFESPRRAGIPRNIEMSDEEYRVTPPVRIRLRVERLEPAAHIERCYEIALLYEDFLSHGIAYPRVMEIDDLGSPGQPAAAHTASASATGDARP